MSPSLTGVTTLNVDHPYQPANLVEEFSVEVLVNENASLRNQLTLMHVTAVQTSLEHHSKEAKWKEETRSLELLIQILTKDVQLLLHYSRLKRRGNLYEGQESSPLSVLERLWAELECPICFEAMREPLIYKCGHATCKGCKSDTCPQCRERDDDPKAAPYVLRHAVAVLDHFFSDKVQPEPLDRMTLDV